MIRGDYSYGGKYYMKIECSKEFNLKLSEFICKKKWREIYYSSLCRIWFLVHLYIAFKCVWMQLEEECKLLFFLKLFLLFFL